MSSLALTFHLPESFRQVDDPDDEFFARSERPRSLITIAADDADDADDADVAGHVAEQGEALSELDLTGVDAVVVSDAALDGLPAGLQANELLVSNGDRSSSVIMSGAAGELADSWTRSSGPCASNPPTDDCAAPQIPISAEPPPARDHV